MNKKEQIISILSKGYVHINEIKEKMAVSRKSLIPILDEMVRDGILFHNGGSLIYGLKKIGKIEIKKAGYGFIIVAGEEKDYFVKASEINNIYDGDVVEFYPIYDHARSLASKIISHQSSFAMRKLHQVRIPS